MGEVASFSQMAKSGLFKIIFEEDLNHMKNPDSQTSRRRAFLGEQEQAGASLTCLVSGKMPVVSSITKTMSKGMK